MVVAAYLSRDPTLLGEVREGTDFHQLNKERFGLPTRTVAKRFKFGLLYGKTAWGLAHDSDFFDVSRSEDFWQNVIDEYYKKYSGVSGWHDSLVRQAINTGKLVMPTGRCYTFPSKDVIQRQWFWRPKILNYPVQGTGADLVAIGRVTAFKRIKAKYGEKVLFISTVHDSIDLDLLDKSEELVYNVCIDLEKAINDIPENFYRLFKQVLDVPVDVEIKFGPNLGELTEWKRN